MKTHILQSKEWSDFKSNYGSTSIQAGNVFYTKHAIPLTNSFYAYCPRINPTDVNFQELKKSLIKNNCIACHLDVPNVIKGSKDEKASLEILEMHCSKSPRDEFAKGNFILDLTPNLEDILNNMHTKQRYNIKLAEKKGVTVRKRSENIKDDLDVFFELYKDTAKRQGYFYRSKDDRNI